ncbi:MAG: diguanylate cyclase domain-containing protein [Gammaproteobacteria bacterium]
MRLGGDEFVILLPHVLTARDAAQVAIKTLHAMSEPFTVLGHELHATTSLGVARSSMSPAFHCSVRAETISQKTLPFPESCETGARQRS